ncbi:hypothetical protein MASR2M29_06640 [Spirochaetota bacterium]
MKIAIPSDDGQKMSNVFGRAANFVIYDDADRSLSVKKNEGINAEHGAGTGAASFLAEQKVKLVYAPEVGPKAAQGLSMAGITVKLAKAGTDIKELLKIAEQ